MKITAGLYKDKKINTFSNLNIRPTSSKARQALFNILINRYSWNKWCHKANLLDAFSGRVASVSVAMAITASSEASQIAVAAMYAGLSSSPLVAGTALFKSTMTVAVPSSLAVTN